MKFDGIIIITDLDGTFFNSKGKVAERNIAAVEYFKKNGGLFTIATGRSPMSPPWLDEIFTPLVNAPAILCNGAFCYDFNKKERIGEIELNYEKAAEISMDVHRDFPDITVRLTLNSGENKLSLEDKIEIIDGKYYITGSQTTKIKGWTRVSFDGDEDSTNSVRARFEKEYSQYFAMMKPCPIIYEFQDIRATKGQALDRLRAHLKKIGIADENAKIYAVGDYENDLDLLAHADIAACPDNAIDRVKKTSQIQLCHCDNGAIADLIERIELELR